MNLADMSQFLGDISAGNMPKKSPNELSPGRLNLGIKTDGVDPTLATKFRTGEHMAPTYKRNAEEYKK